MKPIRLDGRSLTRDRLVEVAYGAQVMLDEGALRNVAHAAAFLAEQVRCHLFAMFLGKSLKRLLGDRQHSAGTARSVINEICTGLDLVGDHAQAAADVGQVRRADDALRVQHLGMREAAFDVGTPQPLIEADAGGVALDQVAHRLAEQRRPGLGFVGERVGGHRR